MINVNAKLTRYDDLYNTVGYATKGQPQYSSEPGYPSIYTYELKDGVTWHDGTPLTAEDVKFTYETYAWGALDWAPTQEIKDRLAQPFYMYPVMLKNLDKIETEGDNIVKMYFREVDLGDWMNDMNVNYILPKHKWKDFNRNNPSGQTMEENMYNTEQFGAGPYRVVEHERDQYVIMDRYEDYFDGVPYLEHLVWNIITDPTAAMLALENGEVDTVHEQLNFPAGEIQRVNSDPAFSVDAFPYTTTWRVTPNFDPKSVARWPWIGDKQVRYAMEYAIDKQTIVDQVLFGITKPTSCVVSWIVGAYSGDYNNAENGYTGPYPIEKRDYDPDMAAKILDDAGWTLNAAGVRHKVIGGKDYTIDNVEMPYYHYATSWAEAIAQYWADVGIFIDPVPIESTTFFQGIEVTELGLENPAVGGPYPLSLNTMGGGPDPGDVYDWVESRPAEYGEGWKTGVNNFGFYINERVDELFYEGRGTGEYLERKAIYDELYWRVHDDAGFIMLWNKWKVEAWNNEFAGFGSQRPIAWYGGYFRGTDESSNIEKGVYWRGGSSDPFPETDVITSVVTQVTTQVVSEFMDLRVLAVFALSLLTGVFVYRRRRREE